MWRSAAAPFQRISSTQNPGPARVPKKNLKARNCFQEESLRTLKLLAKFCAAPGSYRAGRRDRGDRGDGEKLRRRPNPT